MKVALLFVGFGNVARRFAHLLVELRETLSAEGIEVTSIGAVTPSLEDVFLDVVERVGAA